MILNLEWKIEKLKQKYITDLEFCFWHVATQAVSITDQCIDKSP